MVTRPGAAADALDDHYAALEARFTPSADSAYRRLVVPIGNADEPFHRWFHMKEAYSPYLFGRIASDLGISGRDALRVHDPFLGSGTTLTSALLGISGPIVDGSGSEVNPFLFLLSRAKLGVLSMNKGERSEVLQSLLEVSDAVASAASNEDCELTVPSLHAFGNENYLPRLQLLPLLRMRDAWKAIEQGVVRDMVGVALASCVEPSSRLRRDGRALRFQPEKRPEEPVAAFRERISQMLADVGSARPRGAASAMQGDALSGDGWPADGTADLVCFSPPYPNNIDYTEVYKLEAWYLELFTDSSEFRAHRHKTMRSHPSVKFAARSWSDLEDDPTAVAARFVAPVLEAIPDDRYRPQRERMVSGFASDGANVLARAFRALRPGGYVAYVVGNSRHGANGAEFTIAADILLAAIAAQLGFDVVEVKVARDLHRRGRHEHLRESVVFLQRPTQSGSL